MGGMLPAEARRETPLVVRTVYKERPLFPTGRAFALDAQILFKKHQVWFQPLADRRRCAAAKDLSYAMLRKAPLQPHPRVCQGLDRPQKSPVRVHLKSLWALCNFRPPRPGSQSAGRVRALSSSIRSDSSVHNPKLPLAAGQFSPPCVWEEQPLEHIFSCDGQGFATLKP